MAFVVGALVGVAVAAVAQVPVTASPLGVIVWVEYYTRSRVEPSKFQPIIQACPMKVGVSIIPLSSLSAMVPNTSFLPQNTNS